MPTRNLRNSFSVLLSLILLSCNLKNDESISSVLLEKPEIKEVTSGPKAPLMGWASWNNYRVNINESIIRSQVDAMVTSGLKNVGYSFINIDDGFYGGRDKKGNLLVHKERFPSGMKSLAEYIHAKGLKAGIYSDAGINTCASYWDKDTIGSGMGLYGHDRKDLTLYLKEWEYDFIKVDWCGGEWLGLDEETRYSQIGRIIRAINPNVIYNVCRWQFPGKWVTQVADSWRISGDISNRFESILRIIDLNADLWAYSSAGHYNDMDMLQVGRGMTLEEDRTHFSMWCLMHSPLLLGNDLTTMSEETLKLVSNLEMIALNQSRYVYQARRLVDYGDLEVWAKPLIDTMSGEIAVGLLNRSDTPANITFKLSDIGIEAPEGYTIRDIWANKNYKTAKEESINMEVPGHGIVVLKVKGKAVPFNVFQFKERNW